MKYRVRNKETGKDITDQECWVLMPDGRIVVNEYGDLVGRTYAEVVPVEELQKEVSYG